VRIVSSSSFVLGKGSMRFARMEKTSDGLPRISRKDDDDHEDEGEIPL
jgi:hypothetical protein